MRSFGLTSKIVFAAAVLLLPVLAEIVSLSQTAPAPAVSSATQGPGDAGQPEDRGCTFDGVNLAGGVIAIESQDRRFGRKIALQELNVGTPLAVPAGVHDRRTSDQPLLASWVTTLTTVSEPCSVLCCFLY
jgi:hypothetical protein